MSATDSEILFELMVDITDLSILGENEVDFFACLADQGVDSIGFFLGLLPLLAEVSPFLFL